MPRHLEALAGIGDLGGIGELDVGAVERKPFSR
jgi:hypothetical protein